MTFLDFGEDDEELELKFDDCAMCKLKNNVRTCRSCDSGEFFEEVEPTGVDALFRD